MKNNLRIKSKSLLSEWLSGPVIYWRFPVATKVVGFEVAFKTPGIGIIKDIMVNHNSQLVTMEDISIIGAAQFQPEGLPLYEIPQPGWFMGPWDIKTLGPADTLKVITENFDGMLRPFGMQLDEE